MAERKIHYGFTFKFYLAFTALICFGAGVAIALTAVYQDDLPSIEEIYNIEPPLVTTIYSEGGELLQKYHRENRVLVPYSELPLHLIQALVATEDVYFYDHWGVHWRGFMRAVLRNVVSGFGSQGGSTITQQLARMLFLNREVTIARKIKEALTAIEIERNYSKNEIIEMYLNHYFFGNRSYGIETAARSYFNKNTQSLTIEEAAALIGVLNAPSRYSPTRHPERALSRRNHVLNRMEELRYISRQLCDSLKAIPIKLNLSQNVPGEAPYFTEMVRQHLIDKYGEDKFYQGGLSVQTTLNTRLQKIVDLAVKTQLDSIQARIERRYRYNHPAYTIEVYDPDGDSIIYEYKQIQAAFVAIDNKTGGIISLVGGKDFSKWKFNNAVQALRQPGSAFKPFVYTAAINAGFHPSDILYDTPIVLTIPGSKEWRPHNFDDKFDGPMTLREGLARSRNLIAIKLMQMVEPERVIFYASKMGISTPLTPNPSLAIGTSEVYLLDLVSAYSTFPTGGIHITPRFITKVTDRYGNILEENQVLNQEVVLTAQVAYMMVNLMQSTLDHPRGTGRSARRRGFMRPAGGKTGTSDSFCDNWFIGYTPQITAGCWVGFSDKTSIGKNQTGATNGLPIWAEFMIAAHDSLEIIDFPEPDGILHEVICLESGMKATPYCTETREEVFLEEFPVNDLCPIHRRGGRLDHGYRQTADTTGRISRF